MMSDNTVSESESTQNADLPKKRKSGHCHPEKYIRNINKNKKLKGLEYRTYKGKLIPARVPKESCGCKRLKCFERLSADDRLKMLTRFRSLDSKNEQDTYAQSFIEAQPVERNRSRVGLDLSRSKAKSVTFKYYADKNGQRVEVCKNALCQILTMTRGEIDRLCLLQSLNRDPIDLRGFNPKAHSKPPEVQEKIMEFLLSLPKNETHYNGKECFYLDSSLNIKTLYQMFIKKHDMAKDVNYYYFYKVYRQNFGYRFGRPQVEDSM